MEKFGTFHTAEDLKKFLDEIPQAQRERLPLLIGENSTIQAYAYETTETEGCIERGLQLEGVEDKPVDEPTKAYIEFATNYNGVYLTYEGDSNPALEKVCDEIADTFPSYTYEWCNKWDYDLTNDQQQILIDMAQKMINKEGLNVKVDSFKYDHHST